MICFETDKRLLNVRGLFGVFSSMNRSAQINIPLELNLFQLFVFRARFVGTSTVCCGSDFPGLKKIVHIFGPTVFVGIDQGFSDSFGIHPGLTGIQ
jgi:hypothetical protein